MLFSCFCIHSIGWIIESVIGAKLLLFFSTFAYINLDHSTATGDRTMQYPNYQELTDLQRKALNAAEEVLKNSYNPYSNFFVGAALFAEETIVSGTNFENAAYGSTICAERSATFRANAMGLRRFSGIAIIARGANFDTTEVTGPCGSCRQVLYELAQLSGTEFEVVLSTTKKDKVVIATIKELLPLGFGPLDLGIDIARYQK